MQNGDSENDIVYEVKKELSVNNIMQLIDLNGTKKNFQSEFVLSTVDPAKKISICVVNQDQLDNGQIKFEETERGKYSRRITYQNNKHINHYIAVKKHSEDKEEKNVDCLLVIHMKELPPLKIQEKEEKEEDTEENETKYNLNPDMSVDTKEDIRKKLFKLRDDNEYRNMPVPENDDIINEEINEKHKHKSSSFMNSYMVVGLLFLCVFAYIFYIKKIKK
jgi:hypothetical protein